LAKEDAAGGQSSGVSPFTIKQIAYLRFPRFVASLTVVRGFDFTVDCFTKRPVIAERPRLPGVLPFAAMRLSSSSGGDDCGPTSPTPFGSPIDPVL
jgi:hypothetical protein